MALARLNAGGRFDDTVEENEDGTTTVTNATSAVKSSVAGSTSARFLGEYNPLLNKPLERRDMNTDVVLLPELTQALEELRKSEVYHQHHKQKDAVKDYLNCLARDQQSMKFRK